MGDFLFDQLNFVRSATLHIVQDVSESEADAIPTGFNNNIRWNLGHIYLVQEQFAFYFAQEPMHIPDGFKELFAMGSKPADWKIQPPTLPELLQLLEEQPNRIKEKLSNRLNEPVAKPFTLRSLTLNTIGEFLNFCLYHEGGHSQTIKILKRINEN